MKDGWGRFSLMFLREIPFACSFAQAAEFEEKSKTVWGEPFFGRGGDDGVPREDGRERVREILGRRKGVGACLFA